ncbi:keratin-associated protein 10-11-like [Mya arenaria]|uniref:keratin-associated protein 10-11-like n=1 Tax=Mya arenaria TaxID=6604 RepID=UPI0022E7AE79|nr:keratin-associated protein 10-11-like [Mya arenaria]
MNYVIDVIISLRATLLTLVYFLVARTGVDAVTCSAGGNECASTAYSYCKTLTPICACADIAPDASGTCTPKVCTLDSECIALDANSKCTSGSCTCTDSYYLDGADDEASCVANPVGTTCALGECSGLTGQVCDNTLDSPVCACADGFKDVSSTCTVNAVGDTCTASGYECMTVSNAFCSTSACACGAAFTGDPCVGATCSTSADCITLDANSECVGTACACKANYAVSLKGTSGDCQPGVGATCTASGSECQNLLGGYCATTVCACADIMAASVTVCAATSCTADATCTALDANSECIKDMCVCKSGYALDGTSKSCVATGGSNAITASIAVMLMSLLVSVLQH